MNSHLLVLFSSLAEEKRYLLPIVFVLRCGGVCMSASSSVDYTTLGTIELLPVWILVVPIVVVNLAIALCSGYRHQQKYGGSASDKKDRQAPTSVDSHRVAESANIEQL